jgi:ParB-like chromosome segregation protein Spo0J
MTPFENKAQQLLMAWRAEVTAVEVNDEAEQAAYDSLIEFIEAHDLNHSKFDPREG